MAERTPSRRVVETAEALARHRPTPFYLFDARRASENAQRWGAAARQCAADLFYPYKCNRHPALLDRLAGAGLGAEVTLMNDLTAAVARGIGGERIVVQGPAKDFAGNEWAGERPEVVEMDGRS